jgi:DNA repair exonuclease SbcCD nuclease subunit
MRFLHSADWQIGMKAAHLGEAAPAVRGMRLDAAREVIRAASKHAVDLLLIAGDTFEDNGVSRRSVEQAASILGSAPCPVYLIPGNHDPLGAGSVWEHPVWNDAANVHVLREAAPVDLGEAILYPCPLRERWSNNDPTAWIPRDLAPDRIHIGLAHGTIAGLPDLERSHPIAAEHGLDYLALGHWHSTALHGRTVYCGTPEPSRFGERDSGNALLVEIAAPHAAPRITRVSTGRLRWISHEGSIADLLAAVGPLNSKETSLVHCHATGWLTQDQQADLERLQRLLRDGFLFARLDTSQLLPVPGDDRWIEELPPGYLREAATRLVERRDEIGTQALMELYGLSAG